MILSMEEVRAGLDGLTLVSKITGQDVDSQSPNSTVLFLAALITVLSGVVAIDRSITDDEEQHLKTLLNAFIPPGSSIHPLMQKIIEGVEEYQMYLNPQYLSALAAPLSVSERLLMLSLGYETAAADGEVDMRERLYLQAIAHRLEVPVHHIEVLEAGFVHHDPSDSEALEEVKALLNPSLFESLDIVCVNFAKSVLAVLSPE
ncbi:TerB family tellurite resistance protein [Oscillatoria sp. FACHB-1407]|uniref:tellurite resistance TerB family protein n=1 Tax=Oscillatoria sp. FACHB-1407 TaxID=2692847 RepID=UPI0016848334|nr:TerB family tellurite resistance protein [Oscillatoria sp. FACHB-1407]MBD2464401.1 TerB family tellurite resistance protein [Oscillatoria sp. FACHB-1407]